MCTEDNMVIMCVTVAIIIMVQYYYWCLAADTSPTGDYAGRVAWSLWPVRCRGPIHAAVPALFILGHWPAAHLHDTISQAAFPTTHHIHRRTTINTRVKLLRPGHGKAPCDGVTGNIPIIWEDIVVVVGSHTTLAHGCLSSPR